MEHTCGCLWILEVGVRGPGAGGTGVCKLWVQGTEIKFPARVAGSAVNYSAVFSSCYFQFLFF